MANYTFTAHLLAAQAVLALCPSPRDYALSLVLSLLHTGHALCAVAGCLTEATSPLLLANCEVARPPCSLSYPRIRSASAARLCSSPLEPLGGLLLTLHLPLTAIAAAPSHCHVLHFFFMWRSTSQSGRDAFPQVHVELSLTIFVDSNGAVAVHRGALTFGLRLGEVFNVAATHACPSAGGRE